jgi:hypothetical protein
MRFPGATFSLASPVDMTAAELTAALVGEGR